MPSDPTLARRLWQLLEPIHVVTYFAPEPLAALKEAGYLGYWMGYFAQRSAPLGPVGPEVVHALFANFPWGRVARALPSAWEFAPPEVALRARLTGSVAALRRQLGDLAEDPGLAEAAEVLAEAASSAPMEARALFAAHRALPWPEDPVGRLWHAATLLREHRGDGHVAVLLAEGVDPRDAHVLHALDAGTPPAVYAASRDLGDEEWAGRVSRLERSGLVTDGALSPEGAALRARIEKRTDLLAATAFEDLDPEAAVRLAETLLPVARAVAASGDLPEQSPVGPLLRLLVDPTQ